MHPDPRIQLRHDQACQQGRPTYKDPATGYDVFTAEYLKDRGFCCGSGCRHCPYDHEAVPPGQRSTER